MSVKLSRFSGLVSALILMLVAGCATPEPPRQAKLELVESEKEEISQHDLEGSVQQRILGFYGEPGWLLRFNEQEFAIHDPEDGQIIARKAVEGRLSAVGVSPAGDKACVAYGSPEGAMTLGLYDGESGDWLWTESLINTPYMVVANVGQCLVGYKEAKAEVFQIQDGKVRVRQMTTPAEPMGVFSIRDGRRQWWISPMDVAADEAPGWLVTQVESDGWTFEGDAQVRCFEADKEQIRAIPAREEDEAALAEMARRSQRSFVSGACEPGEDGEWMRFADGDHRLMHDNQDGAADEEEKESEESEEVMAEQHRPDRELPDAEDIKKSAQERLRDTVGASTIRRGQRVIRRFQ